MTLERDREDHREIEIYVSLPLLVFSLNVKVVWILLLTYFMDFIVGGGTTGQVLMTMFAPFCLVLNWAAAIA